MYGSNVDENGKALSATGSMPLITGERVPGHTIEGLFKAKDKDGNELDNRWEIHFRQANGKLFTVTFFGSEEKWAIDATNRTMLHICTRIVSEEDYYASVAGSRDFNDFMNKIATSIMPKAAGKTFTLKIVYQQDKSSLKWYAKFPKYPNFIEVDGTEPSTLKTDARYDIYVIPQESTAPAAAGTTATASEDVF